MKHCKKPDDTPFYKIVDSDQIQSEKFHSTSLKINEHEIISEVGIQIYSKKYGDMQRFCYKIFNKKRICANAHEFVIDEKIFGKVVVWFHTCFQCGTGIVIINLPSKTKHEGERQLWTN
ncbi:MAG: hypothetical protein K5793_03765 [Nitrosarchaeum sp.]|nr:hypothetical protein [Nitrosarchaeum sp.]